MLRPFLLARCLLESFTKTKEGKAADACSLHAKSHTKTKEGRKEKEAEKRGPFHRLESFHPRSSTQSQNQQPAPKMQPPPQLPLRKGLQTRAPEQLSGHRSPASTSTRYCNKRAHGFSQRQTRSWPAFCNTTRRTSRPTSNMRQDTSHVASCCMVFGDRTTANSRRYG
ncbi:hypothetical protein N9L68_01815 [bacterium]|nr:hypothetical protein [bacterium]